MRKNIILSKILAILGTVLIWLPIAFPLGFAAIRLMQGGRLLLDYLMPAELFPLVLLGSALLLWAAWRVRLRLKPMAWTMMAMVVLLFGSQGLAVVTGLASGKTEADGWEWALVLGGILLYNALVVVKGILGIALIRDLFKKKTED